MESAVLKRPEIRIGKKTNLLKKIEKYEGIIYIAPWIIGFLSLQLYPLLMSFYYSLTEYSIMGEPQFIGLGNYIHAFTRDRFFYGSLKTTFIYVFLAVPLKLTFALMVAIMLNVKLRTVNLYRTIYYIPSLLGGSVAIATIWKFLFSNEGAINNLLSVVGIEPIGWISNPKLALFTISGLTVWQFGSSMVIFLAGLKQIPMSLYEAAIVDGANKIQMFFKITLPMLTPVILFNMIMQMINAFQEFTSAYLITNGGPLKSTYLFGLMIYENAFTHYRMGYASALSWILFIVILLVTFGVFKSSKKWVHYEDGGEF